MHLWLHPSAISLILLGFAGLAAGPDVRVRGVVRSAETMAPLPYAVVEIIGTARRFSSDGEGRYLIRDLAEGSWVLRARAVGHVDADIRIRVTAASPATMRQDFALEARPIELDALLVEGRRAPRPVPEEPVGAPPARIEQSRIAATPTAFEPDVLKVVQTLPSVATASDYSSALYVRGGTPDQTIVLLDGTPLFNPYHVGGLFSAIDAGLVEDVVAHVGPMSATLGDRLAGIVEINSRAPPLATTRGWGLVSLISTSAGLSAPIGEGGYTVALRHTYLDVMSRAAKRVGLIGTTVPYGFSDGYGHVRQRLAGGELRVSGYLDLEYLSPPGDELPDQNIDFAWGTGAGSASWEGPISRRVSMRASLGYSDFRGDFLGQDSFERQPVVDGSLLNRLIRPAVDFLWLDSRHDIRFGAAAEFYRFGYAMSTSDRDMATLFPEYDDGSNLATLALHAETEWSADERTRWRVGARALAVNGGDIALMPRIGWSRDLDGGVMLFAAAGRKAQAVRSLRSEEAVFSAIFAYDVLAPTGGRIALADEVGGGVEWRPRPTTSLRVEAYARRAHGIRVAPVPANIYFTPLLAPEETDEAEDRAAGLEVSATHRQGDTEVWLAYSGSWLQRTVGEETFRPRFHRVHQLQLIGSQSISGRTALSASAQLASGQSYSRAVGIHRPLRFSPETGRWSYDFTEPELVLEERNRSRLPLYFRLDLGIRSSFTPRLFGRDVTISPYASVLNAVGYSNSLFVVYQWDSWDGDFEGTHAPQMPLLPTFGMEWRF